MRFVKPRRCAAHSGRPEFLKCAKTAKHRGWHLSEWVIHKGKEMRLTWRRNPLGRHRS